MYDVRAYGGMITDSVRMDAYVEALRGAVRPDSVVLDIGTGTGIFALLSCKFGARKVYAIDPSDAIAVARDIAAANGYQNRIEFIQDLSTRARLPEQADVMISDMRGVLPLCTQNLPSIVHARENFLAPGGIMIPQRDTLWAAVVESPENHEKMTAPWDNNKYGLDMRAARQFTTNNWNNACFKREQLLSTSASWASLDYTRLKQPNASGEVALTATRSGIAHGFVVWFDGHLAEGVSFSNAPGGTKTVYGTAFFPWPEPVELAAGDTICAKFQANLVENDYVWRWDSSVHEQGDSKRIKADFKQSSFYGSPLSIKSLRKRAAGYVPALDEDGKINQRIFSLMDSHVPLGNIAHQLAEQFPSRFSNWQNALSRVGKLSTQYSQ